MTSTTRTQLQRGSRLAALRSVPPLPRGKRNRPRGWRLQCLFPPRGAVIGQAAARTSDACPSGRCGPIVATPLLSPIQPYNPTLAAALSWNRLPARIYFLTMGKLLWPVWAMIARSLTPACAAAVARPARKEWPA